MQTETDNSPVIMQIVERPLPKDREKTPCKLVEVRRKSNDELLASCMLSDDLSLERIADALSAKKLPAEANRFRAMIQHSRRHAL